MSPDKLPLRDIHLPEAITWWPPAIGWWLLALALFAGVVWVLRYWLRRQRKEQVLDIALRELEQLPVRYGVNTKALLRELTVLLRRVAISRYGRERVAGLTGMAWVNFLDAQAGRTLFGKQLAYLLTEVPYRPETQADTQQLLHAIRLWIKLQRGQHHV
ncbi:MAG: DUF4381 domain-containing protein [Thiothrix sp.]